MLRRFGSRLHQASGPLALFLVLTGGIAYAANTIGSSDIINESILSQDIKNGQVASSDVRNDNLANGGLQGVDVLNNSLTGDDINESSLGQVPTSTLGGFGRHSTQSGCDPESETFVACSFVTLTTSAPSRVLVLGRITAWPEYDADSGYGECRIGTTSGPLSNTTTDVAVNDNNGFYDDLSIFGVTPPLGPGVHSFGIDCNQGPLYGAIWYKEAQVSAVALSPN